MDSPRVKLAKLDQLGAALIGSRIHEKRRFASAFKRKLTEFQHMRVYHKLNKLFFIFFHQPVLLSRDRSFIPSGLRQKRVVKCSDNTRL